jgi:hypothetical protein
MPLHVSSNKCSSSGGPNCINTSSGITHSGGWLSDVPVLTRSFLMYLFHASKCFEQQVLIIRRHVEAWNKYIKKECVKLVVNQNYVKMLHGQQNIKLSTVSRYQDYQINKTRHFSDIIIPLLLGEQVWVPTLLLPTAKSILNPRATYNN